MCFPANVLVSFFFFLFFFQSPAQLRFSLDCVSAEGQIAAKWSIRVTSELLTVCTSGSFPSRWRQLQGATINEAGEQNSSGASSLSWNFLLLVWISRSGRSFWIKIYHTYWISGNSFLQEVNTNALLMDNLLSLLNRDLKTTSNVVNIEHELQD